MEVDWPEKILRSFYHLGKNSEALYFLQTMKPSLKDAHDIAIYMDLLIGSNITDAFVFQRANANSMPNEMNLLHQLLDRCFSGKDKNVL